MPSNNNSTILPSLCALVFFVVTISCDTPKPPPPPVDPVAHKVEISQWHEKRIASLTSQTGWLNLSGLFWLDEGEHTFGAHASNDLVFPADKVPDYMGSFIIKDGKVGIKVNSGVDVLHDGAPIMAMDLVIGRGATELTYGTLSWFIIEREGGSKAVRLRDSEHPDLQAFKGVDMYDIDPAWRVQATIEPYDPPKMITVPTVYGTVREQPSPGALVFEINGEEYRLDPIDGEQLFVIFADETNGEETYGAGRFLYVDPPGADGTTFIDFNKAHNPPCAFTAFATCPLPPLQNRLAVTVTAGERRYEGGGH